MISINVTIDGDKVILQGLTAAAATFPDAANRGLARVAKGSHREAFERLSGPGAKASYIPGGGYPVPVRTGHLRRSLDWLKPNTSKSAGGQTFSTGDMESMVYDSAAYAVVVHEGIGSSAAHGPRRFIDDALRAFNGSNRIAEILTDEIDKNLAKKL